MKTLLILCSLSAMVLARPQETYSTKYDNFNAKELAENVRLLKSYGKCFLVLGPCTPEGSDFKEIIPDALKTSCAKCSPKQRELIRTVVQAFKSKLPDMWDDLVKKHDPNHQYQKEFNALLQGTD